MNRKNLRLVPEDLIIRVSRMFKIPREEFGDTVGQHIVDCLEMIEDEKTRRWLVVAHLPVENLGDKDKGNLHKWEEAKRSLMGVWQGKVEDGAVWGNVVCVVDDAWKSHVNKSRKANYWRDMVKLYKENTDDEAKKDWLEKCLIMCGGEPEQGKDK